MPGFARHPPGHVSEGLSRGAPAWRHPPCFGPGYPGYVLMGLAGSRGLPGCATRTGLCRVRTDRAEGKRGVGYIGARGDLGLLGANHAFSLSRQVVKDPPLSRFSCFWLP